MSKIISVGGKDYEIKNAVYSMTGYGKGTAEKDGLKMSVELKAVNHRFLDLSLKSPKALAFADDMLRKLIQANISRGHIDVYVGFEDGRQNGGELSIDYSLAGEYVKAANELSLRFGMQNNLYANEILRIPDVVKTAENENDENLLTELLKSAALQAISQINAMKEREGLALVEDLLSKVDNVESELPKIQRLAPIALNDYRSKLRERITDFLKETPIDEVKIINEVAFYSDRVCMDEEITRLYTHVSHFRSIICEGGAVGKRLDFIVQEMNRESNTIGSKCNDAEIAKSVVFLKSEIEKIREQIQNLG